MRVLYTIIGKLLLREVLSCSVTLNYFAMKRFLFFTTSLLVIVCVVLSLSFARLTRECDRLRGNQHALLVDVENYKSRHGRAVATVELLELRVDELRRLREEDARKIRSLGVRLRRAESYAKSVTHTALDVVVPLDSAGSFDHYEDHVSLSGYVELDSLHLELSQRDTLYQVVHRVPHKFLCFSFGTKAIRQDVWSSNPNTEVIFTEYVELRDLKRESRRAARRAKMKK